MKVFDPLKVNTPAPILVSELLAPLITPLKVTSLSTFNVRLPPKVAPPLSTRVPPKAASPSDMCPAKLSPLEIVLSAAPSPLRRPAFINSEPVPSAKSLPSLKVPVVKVVPPAYEFVPLSVVAP